MITVTEDAAHHLKLLLASKEADPETHGLRLFVEKGGCAGMSYAMQVGTRESGDDLIEKDGAQVFVAEDSREWLEGITLDYEDALNDSGFKIENPNAARSCGCGTSFEPTREDAEPTYDPETMDGGESCSGSSN
ncbi:MAG: iron-sulfur cluster assembly accessory protein [Verrucomicrobiota bacterium]